MLRNSPAGGPVPATKVNTDAKPATPRYANTDEMAAEFGDYRVNTDTRKLCDSNDSSSY